MYFHSRVVFEVDPMANGKESFEIRPCTLDDEYGACAVCLSTGDSGKDGSKYYDDPNILGYRYVSPYIHFSPGLGFVLESDDRQICGYVLGTLESNQFYQRYVNEWLPKMRKLYPRIPTGLFELRSNFTEFDLRLCFQLRNVQKETVQ